MKKFDCDFSRLDALRGLVILVSLQIRFASLQIDVLRYLWLRARIPFLDALDRLAQKDIAQE